MSVGNGLALSIVSIVLAMTMSACASSSEGDASSKARTESPPRCAKELAELRVSDVDNVVGCGDAVILREQDLNSAYPEGDWSEDSGQVNQPMSSIGIAGTDDCRFPSVSVDVIGAQVVELQSFSPSTGEKTLWQDVIVLNGADEAKRMFDSQMALIECGEDVERISPDGNFGGFLTPPIEIFEEGDGFAIVDGEFGEFALALMHKGQYYSQLWFGADSIENGMADRYVELASSRLERGSG